MAAYYVFGIAFVVWAIFVTAAGLTRERFPPSLGLGRAMIAVSAVLIVGTLAALLATTHKEHPREAAKAEAAQKKEEAAGGPPPPAAAAPEKAAKAVKVVEKEYSLNLAGGNALNAGRYVFAVANVGKIPHNLSIEGAGIKETKTPLIAAGKEARLDADLGPGKYKFYCSVPGHEQLGMKSEVTVR